MTAPKPADKPSARYSFSVLRIPNFQRLFFTRMFSMMALQSQAVIIGWQIFDLTGSPFMLGLTGLVEAVPAISCALFAGHVVDNSHPQRVLNLACGALTLNAIFLLMLAGGHIDISRFDNANHTVLLAFMYAAVFISGLARSFIQPSSFTLLSNFVTREDMPSATGWMSTGLQFGRVAAPAFAGLLYGGYGAHGAWFLPTVLIALGFIAVSTIRMPAHVRPERRDNAVKSIKEGWSFLTGHHALLSCMLLDMLAVLFGDAVAMLPAFAGQVLHVGPDGLGALRAAPAVGAVFTTLVLALRPMTYITAKKLLWTVVGFGICIIGFGLSTSFWLSMAFLMVSGAFDSISMNIRGVLMQLLTPANMRGRISSLSSMFIISSNEIGAFESGTTAQLMGLVPSVVFGGFCTLGITGAIAYLSPKFRNTVVNVKESAAA
ncbi:MAG: MFS transporter [Micavibrio sp.]|nr:MFS transporter [Micavibrio sp.]